MGTKDFNRQMEEAWEKISESSSAGGTSLSDDFEQEILNTRKDIALESLQILRSRYRREKEYWEDIFHKKNHEIKTLQGKLAQFERELSDTRGQLDNERLKGLEQLKTDIHSSEDKKKEFEHREEAFRKELGYYQCLAEDANSQLAIEKQNFMKLRDMWQTKEKAWGSLIGDREEETAKIRQEYAEKELELFQKQKKIEEDKDFLDLEVARLKSALEIEQRHSRDTSKDSQTKINEYQEALDKACKQFDMEKKLREININEFKQYKAEIQQLKEGRQRMLEEWDKERKEWRDLWEKERLIWEKRKQEVIEWEKRLRQERERWILSGVPEPDKLLKEFFPKPAPVPEAPSKETEEEKLKEQKPKTYLRPILAATWNAVLLKKRTRARKILLAGFAVITISLGLYLLYQETETYPLPRITPVSFSIDANRIVIYDREKASLFFFLPGKMNLPVRTVSLGKQYSVDSCVLAGGFLWTCDTQKKKIYLHRTLNPLQIEGVFPAPSARTTLLAWDGHSLWSYDAEKEEMVLHRKDPTLSVEKRFFLPDVEPAALCWWKNYLWVYDKFSHEVFKFRREGETLIKVTSYYLSKRLSLAPVRDVTGIGFRRNGLWISGGKEKKLVRFNFNRIKLYNLPF